MTGRRKHRAAAGSVSLAFCLVLPAVLFLFTNLFAHSQRVRMEVDLARITARNAHQALAMYDRELYADFGLFGVSPTAMARASSTLGGPAGDATYTLETSVPLMDPAPLCDGIARHMSLRAGMTIVADIVDRYRSVHDIVEMTGLVALTRDLPSEVFGEYAVIDPQLPEFDEAPEWLDEYNEVMDDEVRSVYQDALSHLAPVIVPNAGGDHDVFDFNPFEDQGLDRLGSVLDHAMWVAPEGFLDRLVLCEYTLAYFRNAVPYVVRSGVSRPDRTPDGRVLGTLLDRDAYEAEMIATGLSGRGAYAAVNGFAYGCRLLIHLAHILGDEAKRQGYMAGAAATSALIATLTVGTVVIPPEALAWLLMTAEALTQSARDVACLKRGGEVDFWPGPLRINVPLRYRDFIRLFLVVQSPNTVARRIADTIGTVYPAPYAAAVVCHGEWSGVRVCHEAAFLDRKIDVPEITP
jgi:hypothetical protein